MFARAPPNQRQTLSYTHKQMSNTWKLKLKGANFQPKSNLKVSKLTKTLVTSQLLASKVGTKSFLEIITSKLHNGDTISYQISKM